MRTMATDFANWLLALCQPFARQGQDAITAAFDAAVFYSSASAV